MRIPNRDRKSGKMSDKAKHVAGIILAMAGIVLGLIHVLASVRDFGIDYRTGGSISWQLGSIPVKRDGTVRVNTAGEEELERLPGIGKAYALQLIEERSKNGLFYYPEDLTAVHGIGNGTIKKLYQYIDLSIE